MSISDDSVHKIEGKIEEYESKKKKIFLNTKQLEDTTKKCNEIKKEVDKSPSIELIQELNSYEKLVSVLEKKETELGNNYKNYVNENTESLIAFGNDILKMEIEGDRDLKEACTHFQESLEETINLAEKFTELNQIYSEQVVTELRRLKNYMDLDNFQAISFPRKEKNIYDIEDRDMVVLKNLSEFTKKRLEMFNQSKTKE